MRACIGLLGVGFDAGSTASAHFTEAITVFVLQVVSKPCVQCLKTVMGTGPYTRYRIVCTYQHD